MAELEKTLVVRIVPQVDGGAEKEASAKMDNLAKDRVANVRTGGGSGASGAPPTNGGPPSASQLMEDGRNGASISKRTAGAAIRANAAQQAITNGPAGSIAAYKQGLAGSATVNGVDYSIPEMSLGQAFGLHGQIATKTAQQQRAEAAQASRSDRIWDAAAFAQFKIDSRAQKHGEGSHGGNYGGGLGVGLTGRMTGPSAPGEGVGGSSGGSYGGGLGVGAILAGGDGGLGITTGGTAPSGTMQGGSFGGGLGIGGNAAGGTPWYKYAGNNGKAFGMSMRIGVVAAAYAAYRAVDNAAQGWDEYAKPGRLAGMGYQDESVDMLYNKNKASQASGLSNAWGWVQYGATLGMGYASPTDAVSQSKQLKMQNDSNRVMATSRGEMAGTAIQARAARFTNAGASITDPVAAAMFGERNARVQSYAATDAAIAANQAEIDRVGVDDITKNKLGAENIRLQNNRQGAADLAQTQAQALTVQAVVQRGYDVITYGHIARASSYSASGDTYSALESSINAKYDEKMGKIDTGTYGGAQLFRSLEIERAGERAQGNRDIAVDAASQQSGFYSAKASATGDMNLGSYANWLPYKTAMQNGIDPNSVEGRNMMAQGNTGQLGLNITGALLAAGSTGSAGILAAMQSGNMFDVQRKQAQATRNATHDAYVAAGKTEAEWAASDIGKTAENQLQSSQESIARTVRLSRMGIDAGTYSAGLRGNFKPIQAGMTDIYNSGAIAAQATPELADSYKANTKANLGASFAHFAASLSMGGGAEGFGWQVGANGAETGYEGPDETARNFAKLTAAIDGQFTPLQGAYQPGFGN